MLVTRRGVEAKSYECQGFGASAYHPSVIYWLFWFETQRQQGSSAFDPLLWHILGGRAIKTTNPIRKGSLFVASLINFRLSQKNPNHKGS